MYAYRQEIVVMDSDVNGLVLYICTRKIAQCIIIKTDNEWRISSLIVDPDEWKKGHGTFLLRSTIKHCQAANNKLPIRYVFPITYLLELELAEILRILSWAKKRNFNKIIDTSAYLLELEPAEMLRFLGWTKKRDFNKIIDTSGEEFVLEYHETITK